MRKQIFLFHYFILFHLKANFDIVVQTKPLLVPTGNLFGIFDVDNNRSKQHASRITVPNKENNNSCCDNKD